MKVEVPDDDERTQQRKQPKLPSITLWAVESPNSPLAPVAKSATILHAQPMGSSAPSPLRER